MCNERRGTSLESHTSTLNSFLVSWDSTSSRFVPHLSDVESIFLSSFRTSFFGPSVGGDLIPVPQLRIASVFQVLSSSLRSSNKPCKTESMLKLGSGDKIPAQSGALAGLRPGRLSFGEWPWFYWKSRNYWKLMIFAHLNWNPRRILVLNLFKLVKSCYRAR